MPKSISKMEDLKMLDTDKMEDLKMLDTDMFPKYPHSAIICGQTGCGKTEFVLNLLELPQDRGGYAGVFENIVILCPTIEWNKTYKNRPWIGNIKNPIDKRIKIANPVTKNGDEKLQELLRVFFNKYAGTQTLYIIDDCSATKELTKKKDMLSELAFSGRHADQSVWVISQRYNSVLKDLREQTKWVCLFYTKDRDSFENCLRENDVIPTLEERNIIRKELSKTKHCKLILKTDQPTGYWLVSNVNTKIKKYSNITHSK